MLGLDMNKEAEYKWSGYYFFREGEKHITRICNEDVLLMLFEGELHFNEGGIPKTVYAGNYYIQRSGIFQEGVVPSNAKYYYVHFHGSFTDAPKALPLEGSIDSARLMPFFSELERYQAAQGTKTEKYAAFYGILSALYSGVGHSESRKKISALLTHISEDISREYTLDELALLSGYSKNHIINLFRSETGETPFKYIQIIKMNRARQMLADSDMSVSEIAEELGFGGYINFYKTFLKYENCSPLEWRKRKRNLT